MSIKRCSYSFFFIILSFAHCVADDGHANLEKDIKHIAGLMINTLYNHNFDHSYTVNASFDSYLNPDEPLDLHQTILAQEPIQLAQQYQMQMTELHSASTLKNISSAVNIDNSGTTKWHCITPITLSLVKGPIEITYPAKNSIIFVGNSVGSLYIESFTLELSGPPQTIDYLKIRKKNCSQ